MKLKKRRKLKEYKRCPRCGNKCLAIQERCEECDLCFSRLEFASNKLAKKKLLKFDRDYVIYTNKLPKDVSYLKVLLYCIFFGLVGGHYYYVGKYIKGALMTASFILLIFCTIFNAQVVELFEGLFFIPVGVAALAWIVSFSYIVSRKFKVPVTVPEEVNA